MRKNSVRKWLHAVLDFLPLLVIPIFAIYTRNENYNSNIEVQVQENIEITYNQLNYNGNYVDNSNLNFGGNTTYTFNDGYIYLSGTDSSVLGNRWFGNTNFISLFENHKYVFRFYYQYPSTTNRALSFRLMDRSNNNFDTINLSSTTAPLFYYKEYNITSAIDIKYQFVFDGISNATIGNFCIFDLTLMFGDGNEPTTNEFNSIFDEQYYSYNLGHKELLEDITITYNDTDVGSQFVYTLYNATDKYFNCTNLFNLEQVWNWVQLNLFSGNAPLMVYVVWQVIVYEFFMDLIFLLYSVFMFVIDFATNCIDRFTGRANK